MERTESGRGRDGGMIGSAGLEESVMGYMAQSTGSFFSDLFTFHSNIVTLI